MIQSLILIFGFERESYRGFDQAETATFYDAVLHNHFDRLTSNLPRRRLEGRNTSSRKNACVGG